MPPKRPPSIVMAEESMAERIKLERERNGWTPAELADWMTKAGSPMNQSAIWKIENGKPRRRISLNEAVTFAKVFGVSMEELTQPVEVVAAERVADMLERVRVENAQRLELANRWEEYLNKIAEEMSADPSGYVATTLNAVIEAEPRDFAGFDRARWLGLTAEERVAAVDIWMDVCVTDEDMRLVKFEPASDAALTGRIKFNSRYKDA